MTTKNDEVVITCLNCIHIHSWTVKRGAPIEQMRCPDIRQHEFENEVQEITNELEK